ncbi:hypothetical protein AAC387_Pa01g0404 [Persea americana]
MRRTKIRGSYNGKGTSVNSHYFEDLSASPVSPPTANETRRNETPYLVPLSDSEKVRLRVWIPDADADLLLLLHRSPSPSHPINCFFNPDRQVLRPRFDQRPGFENSGLGFPNSNKKIPFEKKKR